MLLQTYADHVRPLSGPADFGMPAPGSRSFRVAGDGIRQSSYRIHRKRLSSFACGIKNMEITAIMACHEAPWQAASGFFPEQLEDILLLISRSGNQRNAGRKRLFETSMEKPSPCGAAHLLPLPVRMYALGADGVQAPPVLCNKGMRCRRRLQSMLT